MIKLKKVLFTSAVVLFFIGALFVSSLGIGSFFKAQTKTYNMQEIKTCITEKDEWTGRNPSLTLYAKDTIYEIPSVWYDEFNAYAFNDNFFDGKEYSLIVNNDEIMNDSDVIYIYGIADESQKYLLSENAVLAEKSNSTTGLIVGIAVLCGVIVLIVVSLLNKKTVMAFLKEFYH